ncbi:hypothetical protein HPB48_024658 [Haemaphysalis longicornis]|uniref:Tetraspanin n=1 Tax=Haemaphysalis longicornis TaxID=44386 RepID=A0A9J6H8X0_HAELO|nr:hypothetical protein HPB48_024658 [Haemaphysalis longicornis]
MTGVGVWLHVAYGGYSTLLPTHRVLSADGLCLTAGAVTFLVAFLGCCGAWFQSRCLLATYFVLVILIFLLEFAAGTLGFVYRRHIGQSLVEEMKAGIELKYDPDGDNGLAELWDHIHTKFECCGVRSYRDWHRIAAWPEHEWVPRSCCLEEFVNGNRLRHLGEPPPHTPGGLLPEAAPVDHEAALHCGHRVHELCLRAAVRPHISHAAALHRLREEEKEEAPPVTVAPLAAATACVHCGHKLDILLALRQVVLPLLTCGSFTNTARAHFSGC